ncbi:MAG: MFS transporter [Bergeyella sp.]|nr:MFS transporter [Bergeyella sp.]
MPKVKSLETLKNKEFRNLLTGRVFMILAFRMLSTLLGWWVFTLTKDPFSIGLIGLSEVIPAVASAFYAGYIIDMNEKKRLLLTCCFAYLVLIGCLFVPSYLHNYQKISGYHTAYFIYGIVFFTGIARAFIGPLIPTMIPKIVNKESLPNAITLNQATFLTSSVSGHALGGFSIASIGITKTLLVIVLLICASTCFFFFLRKQPSENIKSKNKVLSSIREGLSYIYKTKEILGALCLDMFAVLFGGAVAMIVVYAQDILMVGALKYGLLNAAADIGSACIIITLSIVPLRKNQGKILIAAVAGFGLCIIGFGLSKVYWLSFLFLVLSGMLDGISVVIRGTIVQLKTPDRIRGRVLSVNSIFVMSSNEMGQFESGLFARIFGTVKSVVIGGSLTVCIALATGIMNKKLRNMEY